MAKKPVEKGWRERAGLEKRRSRPAPPVVNIIDPNQMSIWDIFDPPGKEQRRCGLLPARQEVRRYVVLDAGTTDSLNDILGDFKYTVDNTPQDQQTSFTTKGVFKGQSN